MHADLPDDAGVALAERDLRDVHEQVQRHVGLPGVVPAPAVEQHDAEAVLCGPPRVPAAGDWAEQLERARVVLAHRDRQDVRGLGERRQRLLVRVVAEARQFRTGLGGVVVYYDARVETSKVHLWLLERIII